MDKATIAALKEKHGNIFAVAADGREVVGRPLTVGEFEAISNGSMSSAEAEDYAVQSAIVWPPDVKFRRAGTISALAETILDQSVFTSPKEAKAVFAASREQALDVVNVMRAVILACYESLRMTSQDVDNLTFKQLCDKAALAEQIIQIQKSIHDPSVELKLEIIDPEEIAEADAAAQKAEFERIQKLGGDKDIKSSFGTARADDPVAAKLHAAAQQALRG